jgi:serine/threonine protein kinase
LYCITKSGKLSLCNITCIHMPNNVECEVDQGTEDFAVKSSRLKEALSFRCKEVGGYRLGKTLGKGSCAVVKLGIHIETGKQAAIKILKPSTLREQKEVLREVEALQRLDHPHIIRLDKVIRENGYTCLFLELGTGGELFEYIMQQGKLDEDEARSMFRQILSGVQYCHAHLVAHRDLKPENLLLDEAGNIKISDFGLSNVLKPGSLFSTWCGSPVYTPPEVVLRKQYNGISMDIWSLGVVLYVLVTGGMPWRLESNVVKNIGDLIAGNYEIPDFLRISKDCADLIGTMLIADSSKRATLETIMSHKWVCEGFDGPPKSHLKPKPLVDKINEDIFIQLGALGYDMEKARKSIQGDRTCAALTAYHHLMEKHQRIQKIQAIQASDVVTVSSPAEFLQSVTRTRSSTHPSPRSSSPACALQRKETSCGDVNTTSRDPPKERPGVFRAFFERFRKLAPPSPKHRKEPTISIAMSHNSPHSPARQRLK